MRQLHHFTFFLNSFFSPKDSFFDIIANSIEDFFFGRIIYVSVSFMNYMFVRVELNIPCMNNSIHLKQQLYDS